MGMYLNPSNDSFFEAINSEIYVDKTQLLAYTNKVMQTAQKNICVSRPRRFGKSMAANMVTAYYSKGCDSGELFRNLRIYNSENFEKYRNRYHVIALNMQEFLTRTEHVTDMLALLKKRVLWELLGEYPDFNYYDRDDLSDVCATVFQQTKIPFVIVIDEWDCVFREYRESGWEQEKYLDFLRDFLKDKSYIHLVYMTGILPIKKYGTHSALNMFTEYSMMDAGALAEYVGFTEQEVKDLCACYHMDFEETKGWYDGYELVEVGSVYSPRSVVQSMLSQKFNNYWNQTETFEALKIYIEMNFDGLKDAVIAMMSGGRIRIDTRSFVNDMSTFSNRDDVLTLLIHLGYLGYDFTKKEVFIPNKEIMDEFFTATRTAGWEEVLQAVQQSDQLLDAVYRGDEKTVAAGIEQVHLETAHLQYNDENALSYTISLAFYAARNYYTTVRELPSGKGFADMAFIPRKKFAGRPALLVELKWDKDAAGALQQIKDKKYELGLEEYKENIILVGINYDKVSREHTCAIEAVTGKKGEISLRK